MTPSSFARQTAVRIPIRAVSGYWSDPRLRPEIRRNLDEVWFERRYIAPQPVAVLTTGVSWSIPDDSSGAGESDLVDACPVAEAFRRGLQCVSYDAHLLVFCSIDEGFRYLLRPTLRPLLFAVGQGPDGQGYGAIWARRRAYAWSVWDGHVDTVVMRA